MIFHSKPRTVASVDDGEEQQQASARNMPEFACENSENCGSMALSSTSGSLLVGPGALSTWMVK